MIMENFGKFARIRIWRIWEWRLLLLLVVVLLEQVVRSSGQDEIPSTLPSIADVKKIDVVVIVIEDFGLFDVSLVQDGVRSEMQKLLPNSLRRFRSSGFDTESGQASILTGMFPSGLGGGRSATTLLQRAREKGIETAHFGLWPETYIANAGDHEHVVFRSNHFGQIVEKAGEYLIDGKDHGKPSLTTIFLPRIDATVDFGGTFSDWDAWGILGVHERKSGKGNSCPDTFRGEEQYQPRYKSCPRHVYENNRSFEIDALNRLIRLLTTDTFVFLTSASGAESEYLDSHSRGRYAFRGVKRSLYDGGIRVPFLYRGGDPIGNEPNLATVDLAPTILNLFDVTKDKNGNFDGVSFAECFAQSNDCETILRETNGRTKPLMWETRSQIPGHCMHESPRFAIVAGHFKLLMEKDGSRMEIYDLSSSPFEKNDLAQAYLDNPAHQSRLNELVEMMETELRAWIDYVTGLNKYEHKALTYPGCMTSLATENRLHKGNGNDKNNEAKKPLKGIIFVVADDMGYGDISKNNNRGNRIAVYESNTPDFDRLMGQGVVFNHFYSNAPVCSPSRASYMTGRLPSHKKVRFHNIVDKSGNQNRNRGVPEYLGQDVALGQLTTMTKFFHDHGFVTGHFGKWHLGYVSKGDYDPHGGKLYALDEYQFYGTLPENWVENKKFPTASKRHDNFLSNKDFLFSSYAQEVLVNRTIDFVDDRYNNGEKFFINLWVQNPHAPLNLATAYDQPAANGFPDEINPIPHRDPGAKLKASAENNMPLQVYRTLLRDQERHVTRLYQRIVDLGMEEEVLFVYTADNGPEERTINFVTVGSADPFRGDKRSLYEGGIRVPFFAIWKNHIPTNRLVPVPAYGADLFPTFAGLAGLSNEFRSLKDYTDIQGKDLSCLFTGECDELEEERALFFEFRDRALGDCLAVAPRFAVRKNQFKLLWEPSNVNDMFPTMSSATDRLELYDVIADPLEFNNLVLVQGGNTTVHAIAKSLQQAIVEYVHSSLYDTTKKPSSRFARSKTRNDMTYGHFFVDEACDIGKGNNLDRLTIMLADMERVICELEYHCGGFNHSLSPTYPATPTNAPTDLPTSRGTSTPEPRPPNTTPTPTDSTDTGPSQGDGNKSDAVTSTLSTQAFLPLLFVMNLLIG